MSDKIKPSSMAKILEKIFKYFQYCIFIPGLFFVLLSIIGNYGIYKKNKFIISFTQFISLYFYRPYQHFMFSYGFFLYFLVIFYKNFLPILNKMINKTWDSDEELQNQTNNILLNFKNIHQQWIKKNTILNQKIIDLEKSVEKAKKNSSIVIKTMILKDNIELENYKNIMMNFYKNQGINQWLDNNKNNIMPLLHKNFIDIPLEKTSPTHDKNVLNKNILKKIDDLWKI